MKNKLGLVVLVVMVSAAVLLVCQQPAGRGPIPPQTTEPATTPSPTASDRAFTYAGLPRSSLPLKILKNRGFIAGYSEARHNPLWVAYRVFKAESPTTHKRPSRFKGDDRTDVKVTHDDYTRSDYDRGHMAPNYAIATRYGRDAQLETFLMSNICPQKAALNQHVWKELEMLVAKEYANRLEEVWIVCGPIFDEQIEKLASGVEIPDAFYKIIVDEKDGKVRALAFVMPQEASSIEKDELATFLTSVDEIERRTKLDFLHELPDGTESALEAVAADVLW